MGPAQQDVSKLLRGHFEGFSLQRLFDFACKLGNDIEINIRLTRRDADIGRVSLRT
jgi:predicted XRE-type DNA-binding protein